MKWGVPPLLETELREYAERLASQQVGYTADEFYELLTGILTATVRHHGEETIARMSPATVLNVIQSQVSELIRLKRLDKLMRKRGHLA
jgi:hypothetical protein